MHDSLGVTCPVSVLILVLYVMRKIILCVYVFFALLVFFAVEALAQSRPVHRLANIQSIYVDRDSFELEGPPCNKPPGKIFPTCGDKLKKREKFLDALERWIGKYGIEIAKDAASADAILKGFLNMYFPEEEEDLTLGRRRPREITSTRSPVEVWEIEAWLENQAGDTLWKSGVVNAPKPGFGWSSISKIKGKELAKEIEYSIKKGR
ncbi:MAG: hypothetical protein AB7G18_17860 [Pyrinomonadaceae bacterium]